MKMGQYCQRRHSRYFELEQFWQAFASRGFVSDSWAFLFTFFLDRVFTNLLNYLLPVYVTCPVWAPERCRISPPHFHGECHKKRLNRGSFVLFTLSVLYLICVLSVYLICLLCCIFQNIQREWHCIA